MTRLLAAPQFTPPPGVNYHCLGPEPIDLVVRALQRIAAFLQDLAPYAELIQIDDWWQHDGRDFYRGPTDLHTLFAMIDSPRSLLEAMPGDDWVCIGIAPEDSSWYLRFFGDWTEDGWTVAGYFDLTLREDLAARFEREALPELGVEIEGQDAATYHEALRFTVFR